MQIAQLEQYGVPVWNVSPLAKNLLVSYKYYKPLNDRRLEHGHRVQISLRVSSEYQTMISIRVLVGA